MAWLEHPPIHPKAVSSIPGQGVYGRQLFDVSVSLKSINISPGEDFEERERSGKTLHPVLKLRLVTITV